MTKSKKAVTTNEPIPETVNRDTLAVPEETKRVVEPEAEKEVIPEKIADPLPEMIEVKIPELVVAEIPVYRAEMDTSLSKEARIIAFLSSRPMPGYVKINDFLKSLYPLPIPGAPPEWMQQGSSKTLRVLLENMQAEGQIAINNNIHRRLGTHYYEGDDPSTKYWNIATLPIEAKAR